MKSRGSFSSFSSPQTCLSALLALSFSILALLSLGGCSQGSGPGSAADVPLRLVDQFDESWLQGSIATPSAPEPTQWSFETPGEQGSPGGDGADPAAYGWQPGPGLARAAVREGRLVGRSSDDFPVFHIERTEGLQNQDLLHHIEVKLRASAGNNLSISFRVAPTIDVAAIVESTRVLPIQTMTTPIVPGDETRTYVLTSQRDLTSANLRHLLVRPTDAADAEFEIESLRIVFRREHLAQIESGVSRQGLSGIFHEALVTRTPQVLKVPVTVPEGGRFRAALGTVETWPVTFRLRVLDGDGGSSGESDTAPTLETVVTEPNLWNRAEADLSAWSGRDVTLELSTVSDGDGRLAFWGSPGVLPPRSRADSQPNVIVIIADTLRRDHLDAYGYGLENAPAIRRMADEGVLFENALVQGTWTQISTPSILASLYPASHRVFEIGDRLPQSAETLAESLREAGYSTLGLSSMYFVGQFSNTHQGFEEFHEPSSLRRRPRTKSAREYVGRLIPWIEEHRQEPFFALLHVFDPHAPYRPYSPYDTLYGPADGAQQQQQRMDQAESFIEDPLLRSLDMPTSAELEAAGVDPDAFIEQRIAWYDGSIRAMDMEVGRLLSALRNNGLDQNTVVALISDHGDEFFEHGRTNHGHSVYGELTNVPLILWSPERLEAGLRIDPTVQSIDLMPTLLDLLQVPKPEGAQGRSLLPLIETGGEDSRPRPAFVEKPTITGLLGPPPRENHAFAVVQDGWKLVYNQVPLPGQPEVELYRQHADPLDQEDVASEHPEVVERLRETFESWRASALREQLPSDAEAAESMSSEELERLRSLGYIQ
ncbi:MAG: sulfatase [Acidobacteriota bacterium]